MPDASTPLAARTPFEARLPCPVCLGVQMEKVNIDDARSRLVLDHCTRCGGVWFEQGEAEQLTQHSPTELWKHIPPRATVLRPPCHGCGTPLHRGAEKCIVCDRKNVIACPRCDKLMERREYADFILDTCNRCKGVWFDHDELKDLWSLSVESVARDVPGRLAQATSTGGDILLESLFWSPGLTMQAGSAAIEGVGNVVGALGSVSLDGAASAAMGAADVLGGAAEGVFSAVMDIISSIFDS